MNLELNQFRNVDVVLDKANDNFIQKQFVSAGDKDGRSLTVQITENGAVGEVIGLTLNLRWHNEASGLTDLSAFSVVDRATSVFKIDYPQNMLTPGKVIAYIQILHGGKVTHTKPFEITVQKLAGTTRGVLATAEYGALVTTLAKANELETEIAVLGNGKVDKNGASQVTWGMIAQDAREQISSGIVAVVGKDSVLEENIVDGQVTPIKTTFIHEDKTLNLFNRYTVKENVFIQGDTGFEVTNSNYCASDYIPVIGGKTYSSNLPTGLGKAFYDANKNRIAGDTLVAPTNARFLRVTTPNPVPLDIMVVEGNATPEYYLPHILTSIDREVKVLKESLPDGKYVEKENVDFIEKDNSINIFNRNTVKKGVFIVGNSGFEETRAGYGASDYIPVTSGKLYSSNLNPGLGKAFYDANKKWVAGDTLLAPENAKYLRLTTPDPIPYDVMVVEGEFLPANYIPYGVQYTLEGINVRTEKRRWENEIITILGDSITAGLVTTRTYWQYANEKMKAKILTNAISSTEISTGGTYPNPFISRYTQIDSRSKLIVVFGGVNDFEHNAELGTFDSRDNATFYGALHNLCNGLYTNYPDAQYSFFTPLRQGYSTANSKGYFLYDYVDAVIEVCGYYGIPVLDLYRNSGLHPLNLTHKAIYFSDGTHPNAEGHRRISRLITDFLESL